MELKPNQPLFSDIKKLIDESKQQVAVTVNATMSMLYWNIGHKINEEILGDKRAEYGKQIIVTLSRQLITDYGGGWGEKQLRHCLQFADVFTDKEIVYTLCRQLSWSHIRLVMFMDDELRRMFYIEMCKIEK